VITMDMLGKLRRMYLCDKLSISEIAKRTGLSRNTIKKWLCAPGVLRNAVELVQCLGSR
jgi:DNA-binding transcriptional regulator LsrR (DeoR family)